MYTYVYIPASHKAIIKLLKIGLCVSVGKKAIPVLREFLVQYNSAEVTVNSDQEQIAQLMEPLGLHHKRAQILMQFSSK